MNKGIIISLSIIFGSLLTSCSVIEQQVQSFQNNASPEILQQINGWIESQNFDVESTKARTGILIRAESWIVLGVPYGSFDSNPLNDYYDGYRADCSGFISMAWQLKNSSGEKISATTNTLDKFASDISIYELLPGDIVNNKRGDNIGHVIMFVSWLDEKKTRFVAFEENGGKGKAVQTELTLQPLKAGGYTISEYEPYAPGPFYFQRYSVKR